MSQTSADPIIGIDWGSSNFRAYLIDSGGIVLDSFHEPAGVATLGRDGMAELASRVRARWPAPTRAYAAGMIGSNVGWVDAGYIECPADPRRLCANLVPATIGALELQIVPGLACVHSHDGAPDLMRGEETELFGLLADGLLLDTPIVALPGTHTKWVRLNGGQIVEFMTAMSGELYDRLVSGGVLSSVVEGPGGVGAAFHDGLRTAATREAGLTTLLFGVRARAIREGLAPADASARLRGLLIGAEIADARAMFPGIRAAPVPLIGSAQMLALYRAALEELDIASTVITSADACARGFTAIDAQRRQPR